MKKKIAIITGSLMSLALTAFAETATSLLPAEVENMITGFAAQLVPTLTGLLTILVPVGLSLWAIGFGVKKGISFLQRRANKGL